jgi:CTP:molybdopterin cytidylyltransferase MocA
MCGEFARVSVAAVVLAAGASRRLGTLKQLVMWDGETLLDRAVRLCREAGCSPVVVVLGAEAAAVRERCALEGAVVIENPAWSGGMGSSVRVGISAIGNRVLGCVIVACDMPAVTSEHMKELTHEGGLAASEYAGRLGVPAYFPAASFSALMELRGDAGARTLLAGARAVPLAGGEIDVDTPEDLARARSLLGAS